jgi:phosphatidylinositol-3-phosphatase
MTHSTPQHLRRVALAAAACALLATALSAGGCGQSHPGPALATAVPSQLPASHSSHVVVIVMENAEYQEVIGSSAAPYVNSLARRYALATNSFAITHPSLPNYLALTSGTTHGITSDCTGCRVSAPNIVDQLEAARISWKAYLEDVPAPCFRGAGAGGYAKKHNPFIYYQDIAGSSARCSKLVGFGQLASDLRAGRLPTYAWITPNLCDDGHDCGVAGGDRFLARTVPALIRELGPDGFVLITWDEGVSDRGCCGVARGGHVATILAGPGALAGARQRTPVDHYGVLGTIEGVLRLPPLGEAADPRAGRLTALLREPSRPLR